MVWVAPDGQTFQTLMSHAVACGQARPLCRAGPCRAGPQRVPLTSISTRRSGCRQAISDAVTSPRQASGTVTGSSSLLPVALMRPRVPAGAPAAPSPLAVALRPPRARVPRTVRHKPGRLRSGVPGQRRVSAGSAPRTRRGQCPGQPRVSAKASSWSMQMFQPWKKPMASCLALDSTSGCIAVAL